MPFASKQVIRGIVSFQRVHPLELQSFEVYKEGWKKTTTKRKADTANEKMLQTKLFCSTRSKLSVPEVDNLIVRFVVDGLHSLSTVEEPGFVALITGLRPGSTVISRRTLGRRIDEEWEKMLGDVRLKLSDQDYVATTADIWSTPHRSFMGVTVHWIDRNSLSRRSLALACRRFAGRHTYDKIGELLEDIRQDFDISHDKIVATVTDNASNFVKAFKEFGLRSEIIDEDGAADDLSFESVTEPDLGLEDGEITLPRHVRCACHTLSLVAVSDVKVALSTVSFEHIHSSAMIKCSALWNCARRPKSSEIIVSALGHSLQTPCVTRWNSLYDSIKDLLRSKDKLRDLCNTLKLQVFQERDFAFLLEYCDVLQPIASALTRLQAEADCFFGELLPTLLQVESKLHEKAAADYVYCKPLLDAVRNGFTRRFDHLLKMKPSAKEATVAAVLHPYFKLRWLPAEMEDFRRHAQKLTEAVVDYVSTAQAAHSSAREAVGSSAPGASNASADAFFSFEDTSGITSRSSQEALVKLEFPNYLQDPRVDVAMLHSYPLIRGAFVKYNTATCSSAPVERLFSFTSLIARPHRGALSDRRFEQMLLLKTFK
ncbi:uncharacterized protein LOC144124718 isoform X2 [Amblyomma americanum]